IAATVCTAVFLISRGTSVYLVAVIVPVAFAGAPFPMRRRAVTGGSQFSWGLQWSVKAGRHIYSCIHGAPRLPGRLSLPARTRGQPGGSMNAEINVAARLHRPLQTP